LLLTAVTVLKLSLSFKAVSEVCSSDIMNITAEIPLTLLSFFVILALIAFAWGNCSASTKFCAKEAVSTPDPALSEVTIFCAAALLAAAVALATFVFDAAVDVGVVALAVVELTEVVAMEGELS
jgi:hypothetical protein